MQLERAEVDQLSPDFYLPLTLLSQYLFFLTRRPISASNSHYLDNRLRGLKSLRKPLLGTGLPRMATALRQLEALQPASLGRLGRDLQVSLLPFAPVISKLPRDLVIADSPPPARLWHGLRRVLVILGPGIGIGDEIVFFPLPRWLKERCPDLAVSVLSAYPGLWSRVAAADQCLSYTDHGELLAALRGEPPYGGFDLVLVADFEMPELYRAVSWEDRIPLYLEISLGSRSAFLVDNVGRRLNRLMHFIPYFENYYFALHQILRQMGFTAAGNGSSPGRFSGVVRQAPKPRRGSRLRLFVSPFTSKYNPSQAYWSHLLAAIGCTPEGAAALPLEIALDSGKNAATERFASALLRSLKARLGAAPQVTLELACSPGQRTLSLASAFDQMEAADAVLCADSFAAHAAPLFGCTTLVLAPPEVENWRVPYARSYYLGTEEPVAEVGLAVRRLLEHCLPGRPGLAPLPPPTQGDRRLDSLTCRLDELLAADGQPDPARLREVYDEFLHAYQATVGNLARRPRDLAPLLHDSPYDPALRRLSGNGGAAADGGLAPELLLHLRDQLERWQSTNLRKLLLAAGRAPGEAAEGP